MKPMAILALFLAIAALPSCRQQPKGPEPVEVDLSQIREVAPEMMGKLIRIEGLAIHVCRESGKRLFMGEESFKVLATNKVPTFRVEWEGSDISVTGYLLEDRIDETYLATWEQELKDGIQAQIKEATHTYDAESKGLDENAITTQFDQIREYRERIKAEGKGYISFFSLKAESIKEIK